MKRLCCEGKNFPEDVIVYVNATYDNDGPSPVLTHSSYSRVTYSERVSFTIFGPSRKIGSVELGGLYGKPPEGVKVPNLDGLIRELLALGGTTNFPVIITAAFMDGRKQEGQVNIYHGGRTPWLPQKVEF